MITEKEYYEPVSIEIIEFDRESAVDCLSSSPDDILPIDML